MVIRGNNKADVIFSHEKQLSVSEMSAVSSYLEEQHREDMIRV